MRAPKHTVTHATDKWPTGLKTAEELSESVKGAISEGRIMELAESGYLPHYRVDGGAPMFVLSEAKQWMAQNIIQRSGGRSIPDIIRIQVAAPPVEDTPPASIANLPGLQQIPAHEYQSGVYFLCRGGEVVYVGQSVSPGARVGAHASDPAKSFDRVYLLPAPQSELNDIEGAFIRHLKPSQQGRNRERPVAPSTSRCEKEIISDLIMAEA